MIANLAEQPAVRFWKTRLNKNVEGRQITNYLRRFYNVPLASPLPGVYQRQKPDIYLAAIRWLGC